MAQTARYDPYRLTGELFGGRYRLEEIAGTGSFGAVYRALDTKINRVVAVKVLKPDIDAASAAAARELFQREAQTAGRLVHPHIVAVTDTGEEASFAFLVMEWLEGRTLEDELRARTVLLPEEALSLLSPVADALEFAHDAGVIHRDIKPANIHLGKQGRTQVKVLDFGIAKVVTSASAAAASRIAGTLDYMAPEQLSGGNIDRRTDVYALGAMLYQMLSGTLPLNDVSRGHAIQQQMIEMPSLLSDIRPDVSPALSRVIQRALANSPEERQQSVRELYAEFAAAIDGTSDVQEDSTTSADAETIPLPALSEATRETFAETVVRPPRQAASQYEPTVVEPHFHPTVPPAIDATPHTATRGEFARANTETAASNWRRMARFSCAGALIAFAASIGIGLLARWLGLTRTPYSYDDFILGLLSVALRDGVCGAFLGAAFIGVRRKPWRLSVSVEDWRQSIIVYGALGASALMLPFVLLRTSLVAWPLELAVAGFVSGLIIYTARFAAEKFPRQR